jgi:hypothetical protein
MMCAAQAGKRGRSVLVLEQADAPGEKIRISGGGRCNFTNLHSAPENFLSQNPHFCISALHRYTARDFIALVERYGIAYHEKTLGQLFCDGSARQIIDLLLAEMKEAKAELRLATSVTNVEKAETDFLLTLSSNSEQVRCQSLVVATGGKSIPKMGASDFGYRLAARFGVAVTETRPALVPLVFEDPLLARLKPLAGIGVAARVRCRQATFEEAILFTHRGLSGPAILQISSYWREGDDITIALLPPVDVFDVLRNARKTNGRQMPFTYLSEFLPKRLARMLVEEQGVAGTLADLSAALASPSGAHDSTGIAQFTGCPMEELGGRSRTRQPCSIFKRIAPVRSQRSSPLPLFLSARQCSSIAGTLECLGEETAARQNSKQDSAHPRTDRT